MIYKLYFVLSAAIPILIRALGSCFNCTINDGRMIASQALVISFLSFPNLGNFAASLIASCQLPEDAWSFSMSIFFIMPGLYMNKNSFATRKKDTWHNLPERSKNKDITRNGEPFEWAGSEK